MMGHILQVVLTFLTPWSYLKGENSPGTIFLFWLLTLVCEIIPFRSLFIRMDTFVSFYLCSVTNKWMEANWVYMNQRYLTSQNYFTGKPVWTTDISSHIRFTLFYWLWSSFCAASLIHRLSAHPAHLVTTVLLVKGNLFFKKMENWKMEVYTRSMQYVSFISVTFFTKVWSRIVLFVGPLIIPFWISYIHLWCGICQALDDMHPSWSQFLHTLKQWRETDKIWVTALSYHCYI